MSDSLGGGSKRKDGRIASAWKALTSPSARWSVLTLLLIGLVVGACSVIGTQVMVAVTGTNQFCGGACHSMQWVAAEYRQSNHALNAKGVGAACHDCHIPHGYPQLLWYKAKAGTKDVIGEISGVISTEEKFKHERSRLAEHVWAEYKQTNSANCRTCHRFTPEVIAKQQEFLQPLHKQTLTGEATCIDCHKGIAHKAPE